MYYIILYNKLCFLLGYTYTLILLFPFILSTASRKTKFEVCHTKKITPLGRVREDKN